jgi:MFS family permease
LSIVKKRTIETSIIAIYLSIFDISVVAPGLLQMIKDFALPIHWGVWVIALPLASFSLFLPLMERWSNPFSKEKWFQFSLLIFAMGSLVTLLSDKSWLCLLGGRVVQSIGASGMIPYLAKGTRSWLLKSTAKRIHGWWIFSGLLIVSPIISTYWITLFDWHIPYFFHLIFSFSMLLLFVKRWFAVSMSSFTTGYSGGIILFGLMILFLMGAITQTDFLGGWFAFTKSNVIFLWVLAIGLIVPLLMLERQKRHPFFEPHLFGNLRLWMLYILSALIGFSWMPMILLPLWLLDYFYLPYIFYGLILSLILIGSILAYLMIRKWLNKRSFPFLCGCGFFLAMSGYIGLCLVKELWFALFFIFLLGVGMCFTLVAPSQKILFQLVSPERRRSGLIVLAMFRAAGSALGLVFIARIFTSIQQHLAGWWLDGFPFFTITNVAFRVIFVIASGISLLGWVLCNFLYLKKD